jgi:transposase
MEYTPDEDAIERLVKRDCTFVLATNDLRLSGEQILTEYKTQSSVEKKFQQLKSPHFVNSLYLKKPSRIEALVYMLLITMMILSVVERVVRREMKQEEATVIGPGGVKMTQPTLRAILGIFNFVPHNRIIHKKEVVRKLLQPLTDSQLKILRCLGLSPTLFTETS